MTDEEITRLGDRLEAISKSSNGLTNTFEEMMLRAEAIKQSLYVSGAIKTATITSGGVKLDLVKQRTKAVKIDKTVMDWIDKKDV